MTCGRQRTPPTGAAAPVLLLHSVPVVHVAVYIPYTILPIMQIAIIRTVGLSTRGDTPIMNLEGGFGHPVGVPFSL